MFDMIGPSKRPRDSSSSSSSNVQQERLNGQSEAGQREAWMMVPGTGKSMEEMLGLGGEAFGKTRTFLDSKGAKKLVFLLFVFCHFVLYVLFLNVT